MKMASFLLPLRPVVFSLFLLGAALLAPPHANAQVTEAAEVGPYRANAAEVDVTLTPPMRRAVRTTRAGAALLAIGGVGTIASAVVLARLDERSCPGHDPFCDNGWAKGMASFSGLVVGMGLTATGIVTLGIGVARRNRLRRVSDVALGVGPDRLNLSLRF